MPNVFKSIFSNVTTVMSNVYLCPSATTAIIIGAQAANKTTTTVSFTAQVSSDAGATVANTAHLANAVAIPTNAALGFVSGKLVLEAGESLMCNAASNSNISVTLSVLEIS